MPQQQKADFWTWYSTVINGSLNVAGSIVWISDLIDTIFELEANVLWLSWPGFVSGTLIGGITALCDAYCHHIQDKQNQESETQQQEQTAPLLSQADIPKASLSWKHFFCLHGAAVADTLSVAGLALSMIEKGVGWYAGKELSKTARLSCLFSSLFAVAPAARAEYRTHKESLLKAAQHDAQQAANLALDSHQAADTDSLESGLQQRPRK